MAKADLEAEPTHNKIDRKLLTNQKKNLIGFVRIKIVLVIHVGSNFFRDNRLQIKQN